MKNQFQNIVINQCFKVIKGLVKWFEKNNTNFNIIIFLKFWKNLPKYPKNISRIKNHQRDNNGFLIVLSKIRSILQNLSNNLNKSQFGQGLLHKNKSQKFGTLWKYFISQNEKPLGSVCDLFSHVIESQNNLPTLVMP